MPLDFRRICVFAGSADGADPIYREAAGNLGTLLAGQGIAVVYGGAKVGLMGAVADGALAAGGEVFGVIPDRLRGREIDDPGLTELFIVDSMHARKAMMAHLSDAFIALPGGWGTFEELFEMITWNQLGIHQKPVGLLNVRGYYDKLIAFVDQVVENGFIRPIHRGLLESSDDPQALLEALARLRGSAHLITTRRIDARGLEIACHELSSSSRADAPVVLALHGFIDHGKSFRPVAEALGDAIRMIAIDFRGHGESDWNRAGHSYYFPEYYVDLKHVIQALGIDRFGFLGHSMGGTVSATLSAWLGDCVTGLVLLEGLGPPGEPIDGGPDKLARFLFALDRPEVAGDPAVRRARRHPMKDLGEAAARMRQLNVQLDADLALALAETATEPAVDGTGLVWRFDPLHRTPSARPFNPEELEAHFRRIGAGVLSLRGTTSDYGQLTEMGSRRTWVKDIRCGLIDGASHNIHHDCPEVVAACVRQWFLGDRKAALPSGVQEELAESPGAVG